MSAGLAVTTTEFEDQVLNSDVPVLVDFWAEWCGPCKMIGPSIEALATEYSGKAKVFKVDVDKEGELASKYNVLSIPAVLVFKGGRIVDQTVGASSKQKYADMIERAL